MVKKMTLLACALACSTQALAGPVMWRNIEGGMTAEQVHALYPEDGRAVKYGRNHVELEDVVITGNCEAEVMINMPEGVVDNITIKGRGSMGGRCSNTVLAALSARYGESLAREQNEGSILARQGTVYVWQRDGVTLRFKRFTNGVFGGAGLGQSSWELTYTTVAEDLGL